MQGLPEMNLKNIKLTNVLLIGDKGIEISDANGIEMENVKVVVKTGPALWLRNGKNVSVEKFRFEAKEAVKVEGALTENIRFEKKDFLSPDNMIMHRHRR